MPSPALEAGWSEDRQGGASAGVWAPGVAGSLLSSQALSCRRKNVGFGVRQMLLRIPALCSAAVPRRGVTQPGQASVSSSAKWA